MNMESKLSPTPSEEDDILRFSQESKKEKSDSSHAEKMDGIVEEGDLTQDSEAREKDPPEGPEYKVPKMPGNVRRKYTYFRKTGLDKKEAYEKALIKLPGKVNSKNVDNAAKERVNPPQQTPRHSKRNRSFSSNSPREDGTKKSKNNNGVAKVQEVKQKSTYKKVLTAVRIGIIPADYPQLKLSIDDRKAFEREVKGLILDQRHGKTKPKFTQLPTYRSGWMIFHCADRETADWLKNQNIWEGRLCSAIEESEFPTQHTVIGYFEQSADTKSEEILGLIEGQNEGINTDDWRVLSRVEKKTCAILTITIDDTSMDKLEKLGHKVDYCYGQKVKLRPITVRNYEDKSNTNNPQPSTSGTKIGNKGSHKGEDAKDLPDNEGRNKDVSKSISSTTTSNNNEQ